MPPACSKCGCMAAVHWGENKAPEACERYRVDLSELEMPDMRVADRRAEARKDDGGKPQVSLIPPEELLEIAALFVFGVEKYSRDNWREGDGLKWSQVWDALMRHALAFWGGEDFDPESGLPHVICVAFGGIVLSHYMKHFPENDDRWKGRTGG